MPLCICPVILMNFVDTHHYVNTLSAVLMYEPSEVFRSKNRMTTESMHHSSAPITCGISEAWVFLITIQILFPACGSSTILQNLIEVNSLLHPVFELSGLGMVSLAACCCSRLNLEFFTDEIPNHKMHHDFEKIF